MKGDYSERVLYKEENGSAFQNMRRLTRKPTQYERFAPTNKWQTGKKEVPKIFNPEEFEKWLWRNGI